MGGGPIINAAVNKVKRTITLNPSQSSLVGIVPDTLACIFSRVADRPTLEAAYNALDWYTSLFKRFAFVAVPGEGLAKAGKEKRGREPERQVLTPVVPLTGPPSYQGVRAAEQVLVEVHSTETVGSQGVPRFEVFKAIGDADSGQVYLEASFEARGIKCFDPLNLPGNSSSTSQPNSYKLLYDIDKKERMSLADWRSLSKLLSNPDLDLSTDLPPDLPLFVPPSVSPVSTGPEHLCFLPLTRDRDGVFSDAPYLGLSIRFLPNSILLEYVERDAVWREAGSDALEKYKKHRRAGLASISQNRERREEAQHNPTSFDGRLLASPSTEPSLKVAMLGVAFATTQTGDFGGLKKGSGVGIYTFLYLYLACEGDLDKVWDTLYYHGIDTFYVRGKRSFQLPLVRQSVVFGVPSNPADLAREVRQSDGSSNLKSGVYVYKNEISTAIRHQAMRQFYPQLLSSFSGLPLSPSEADLDLPVVVMAALRYLEIVPSERFKREASTATTARRASHRDNTNESTSSPLSARQPLPSSLFDPASPSSPDYSTDNSSISSTSSPSNTTSSYTTGLLDTTIKPPLQARLWSDQDHDVEGVGEFRTELLGKVSASFDDRVEPFQLQVIDQDESDPDLLDESDEEEEGEEELVESDGSQDGEEGNQSRHESLLERLRRYSLARSSKSSQLRRERATRLVELITQKIPAVKQDVESLSKLSGHTLREGIRFLEHEGAAHAFVDRNGQLLLDRSSYLEITASCKARWVVSKLLRHLGIGLMTPLVEKVERFLDWGGLTSPAVNRQTILPLLFLRRHVPQAQGRAVLQFIHITSLLRDKWTSDSPPSLTYLENALCKDASPDSPIYCKDRFDFRTSLVRLRAIAGVFDLAPPESLFTLRKRSDLPNVDERELETRLGPFLRESQQHRHLVPLRQLRDKIQEVRGPIGYGQELGTLGKGGGIANTDQRLYYKILSHCWKWIEDLVEYTVGEERFEEVFGLRIDWERSDRDGYIISISM